MRIPHYIIKNHNGIYYFRYVIPKQDLHLYPNHNREIRRTLKTRSKFEAIKRARFYWVAVMKSKNRDIDLDFEAQARAEEKMLGRAAYLDSELRRLQQEYEDTFDPEPMNILLGSLNSHDKQCLDLLAKYREGQMVSKSVDTIYSNDTPPSKTKDQKLISNLVSEFLGEKSTSISKKTFDDYSHQLKLFQRVSNIKHPDEINIDAVRDYKNKIQKLPASIDSKKITKNKSIDEILSLSLPPMAAKTLKKNVTCVAEFLRWLFHQKLVSDDLSSILSGIKNSHSRRPDEIRAVFDDSDLSKMFAVEEYQVDCFKGYSFRYWLPLLALYTGARANELCQLYTDDIIQVDGIHAVRIDDIPEDKQLKNSQSKRIIPIHSKLIDLGFLDYVDLIKERSEKYLFPALSTDKYGYRTKNISRFFNSEYKNYAGFIDRCNIKETKTSGKKVFHSFRHTFINKAKQLGIEPHIIKQLVGHSSDDITMNRYGKPYELDFLKLNIDKIKFDVKHPKKWHKHFYK